MIQPPFFAVSHYSNSAAAEKTGQKFLSKLLFYSDIITIFVAILQRVLMGFGSLKNENDRSPRKFKNPKNENESRKLFQKLRIDACYPVN